MNREYGTSTAFIDLLFNTLIGFVALFFIALSMIKSEEQKISKVNPKAEFLITVTWPEDKDDDVDVFLEDPEGHLVYYARREDGLMHLDRDDMGRRTDVINTAAGKIEIKDNREVVTIRGIVPGEYILNVHMFRKNSGVSDLEGFEDEEYKEDNSDTPVKVMIEKINPYSIAFSKEVILKTHGDEKTVCRFTLDSNGVVKSINDIEKKFVGALPE